VTATDLRRNAHVLVLQELRSRFTEAGSPSRTAALDAAIAALAVRPSVAQSFQADVAAWMDQCFQPSLYSDMTERGDRLMEEVLELLQAHGYDSARVPTLVNYVFGRPVGEPAQEVGGVMVTLAAYCSVAGLSMQADGQAELDRINQPEVMARIRAKQDAKNALHFGTPLPGAAGSQPQTTLLPDDPRIVEKIAAEIEGGKLDHPGFYSNTQLAESLRRVLDAALAASRWGRCRSYGATARRPMHWRLGNSGSPKLMAKTWATPPASRHAWTPSATCWRCQNTAPPRPRRPWTFPTRSMPIRQASAPACATLSPAR